LAEKEEQADRLHDVSDIASNLSPSPKAKVAIVPSRELIAIDAHKDLPDEIPGVASKKTKDCEESNALSNVQLNSSA